MSSKLAKNLTYFSLLTQLEFHKYQTFDRVISKNSFCGPLQLIDAIDSYINPETLGAVCAAVTMFMEHFQFQM